MARYALDTNQLSDALDRDDGVRARIFQAIRRGHRVGTCVPVLCELQVGIAMSARRRDNQRILDHILHNVRVWPIELPLVPFYAEVFHELRRAGRVMSQVDMMLAALCRQMNLTLVTSDRDFEGLPDLRREDWATTSPAP
jgi:tRNA(fMet)-specific endonuclease VapC